MSTINLLDLNHFNDVDQKKILLEYNLLLKKMNIQQRIVWILENLPKNFVVSSSFGLQSVVFLNFIVQQIPNIPVILIDTGYLFSETYKYIDIITNIFNLNLNIFRSKISPAWQETRYGKLWEGGLIGLKKYNTINKIKPMQQALKKLSVMTWFSGLRHDQSKFRSHLQYLSIQNGIFKVLPILDWNNNQINDYINKNNLPCHPLWNKGYLSIGDWHTTHKYDKTMTPDETRFFGLKRECGLHDK
ncbi:Phosphoadenosine phosphosulfate reductase [Buchnera aphidicola (Eriosoma grossulariae)]|uniref:phosphoadenylyl-sulfate reductase n=1 Tax=Buchnera aphidicola TaxID=9 RepID=UPI003464BEF6